MTQKCHPFSLFSYHALRSITCNMQLYQMKAKPPDTLIPTKKTKELTTRSTTLPYHQRHPTIHVIETKRVTKQKAHSHLRNLTKNKFMNNETMNNKTNKHHAITPMSQITTKEIPIKKNKRTAPNDKKTKGIKIKNFKNQISSER